jgi:putative Holliday junction resolvase
VKGVQFGPRLIVRLTREATRPFEIIRRMRVLGIDYGRRRIGLALSDATGLLARPWKSLARLGNIQEVAGSLAAEISALIAESDGLSAVVLGWPKRLNGAPDDQTREVEALAERIRRHVDIPVVLQDERLSSREAESLLARQEPDWRKRKTLLDAMAAAVILQDYLDGLPRAAKDLDS